MKSSITAIIAAIFILASQLALAGGPKAPLSTPELKRTVGSGDKPTLVFFQNPNGGPCKEQRSVLDRLAGQRKGAFNIANVSTMSQSDQRAFYDYGVRSLPSLVLVDKAGKVSRVFPPGIQSIETISSALDGLK